MANLTHLFKVNQQVKCDFDGTFHNGTIKEVFEDHLIVDVNGISDHCYYEEGFNLDTIYPMYNFND